MVFLKSFRYICKVYHVTINIVTTIFYIYTQMEQSEKRFNWWGEFSRRLRLSLRNPRDNREVWYTHISPLNLIMVFVSTLILMFVLVLTFVGYTPILEVLPGYSSEVLRSRQNVIDNIMRLDSMERVINEIVLYNDNISLIMSGEATISQSSIERASKAYSKNLVVPNIFDSIMRRDIEESGRYNIQATTNTLSVAPMIAPADGVVTRQFNIAEEQYGVDIAIATGERVLAVQQGVVIMSLWSPSEGYIVQILHPNNLISIYQNISNVTVERGESVEAGKVIGYNGEKGSEDGDNENRVIRFELWSNTMPLDPETFILF